MANEKNLIPQNKRSQRERKEIASMGAKAANEKRRKRKALREVMDTLLSSPITDDADFNEAVEMGFDMDDIDKTVPVIIALYKKAKEGDIPAIKELRDLLGEQTSDSGQLELLIRGLKHGNDV